MSSLTSLKDIILIRGYGADNLKKTILNIMTILTKRGRGLSQIISQSCLDFQTKFKQYIYKPESELFTSHDWCHGLHMHAQMIQRTWAPHFNKSTENLYFMKLISCGAIRGLLFFEHRCHLLLCRHHCWCGPKQHNIIPKLQENNQRTTSITWIIYKVLFLHVNLEIYLASYSNMSAFIKDI